MTTEALSINEIIDKIHFIKILCSAKNMLRELKNSIFSQDWLKIFSNHISGREIVPKM